jgi:hypothetical protein
MSRERTTFFGSFQNYRSDENSEEIKPLTPARKMKVSFDDSFDPSAFLVAGIFAGISMAESQYAPFGTGAQGFGKYYGGAFADQAIGNIMTEGLFPVALHQDPRYFVKGTGGFWRRRARSYSALRQPPPFAADEIALCSRFSSAVASGELRLQPYG